jgi:hypothetical protein
MLVAILDFQLSNQINLDWRGHLNNIPAKLASNGYLV